MSPKDKAEPGIPVTPPTAQIVPGETPPGTPEAIPIEVPQAMPLGPCVGVRVVINHTDPNGVESVGSVTINVPGDMQVQHILDYVQNYANNGGLSQHTGNASPGVWGNPAIAQVIDGGLMNPAVNLCE